MSSPANTAWIPLFKTQKPRAAAGSQPPLPSAVPPPQLLDIDPADYRASADLCAAVDIAVYLGLPLLITGDPGMGKTQLAYAIAYQLDLPLLRFDTKSASTVNDLLYEYDVVRRFYDAETLARLKTVEGSKASAVSAAETVREKVPTATSGADALPENVSLTVPEVADVQEKTSADAPTRDPAGYHDYITFNELGLAILIGSERSDEHTAKVAKYRNAFPEKLTDERFEGSESISELVAAPVPRRCVILIDEIDKAPRDLPNDLLAEIKNMRFRVLETGDEFKAESTYRPIVVLTSNAEKDIPDAFLRRCAYFHIEVPKEPTELHKIVEKRVKCSPDLAIAAVKHWEKLCKALPNLTKRPGIAELLQWTLYLERRGIDYSQVPDEITAAGYQVFKDSYTLLLKTEEDRNALAALAAGRL